MAKKNNSVDLIFKGTGIIFTGLILGTLMGYFTRMLMVWIYGTEGYGLYTIASVVFNVFLLFVLLGITNGIIRYVSYYKAKGDYERVRGAALSSLKYLVPISLLMAAMMVLFSGELAVAFHGPEISQLIVIFAVVLPFAVLMKVFLGGLRGLGEPKYKVYADDLAKSLSVIIFLLAFSALGFGVDSTVIAYSLGFVIAAVLSGFYLHKKLDFRGKRVPVNGEIVRFSLPLTVNIFLSMILSWADIIILGLFFQPSDVGVYNVALPTAEMLLVVATSFLYMFIPVITSLYAKNKMEEIRATYNAMMKWLFMLVLPLFVLLALFSSTVLNILFGPGLIIATTPLVILAAGYFMDSMSRLSMGVMQAIAKTRTILMNATVSAVLNLALNLLLIPQYGIVGAAVATATSLGAYAVMNVVFTYKYIRVQPVKPVFIKPIIATFAATGLFFAIGKVAFADIPLWYLIAMFPCFLLVYALMLLGFRTFNKDDIELLKRINKRLNIGTKFIERVLNKFV